MTRIPVKIGLSCLLLFCCAGPALSGGTAPGSGASATVTGTVIYRERIALPPDAVLRVQLRDVSLMDVAAVVIAEQVITPAHALPIPFVLHYDPNEIDERMTYSVFASIRSGERLLFISDRSYPVLTRGHSDRVDLVLKKQ